MKKQICTVLVWGVAVLGAADFAGATNIVQNGSFEADNIGLGNYSVVNSLTGWNITGGTYGVEIQSDGVLGSAYSTPYGSQYLELDSDDSTADPVAGAGTNSKIEQLLATTIGETYTLSFAIALRPDVLQVGDTDQRNISSMLEVYYGGTSHVLNAFGFNTGYLDWTTYSYTFVATSASTLLSFAAVGFEDTFGALLDDVSVTSQPVPEPATMLLLGSGLAGLVALKRRRKAGRV